MMGGAWFEEYFGEPDRCDLDVLAQAAKDAVRDQLRIHTPPCRTIVNLQKVSKCLWLMIICLIIL